MGKYLTFLLAEEEYGIPIENVQEIIPLLPITRVPKAPDVVLGVINLRGKIVPVFDLHRKFAMPAQETTRLTCIVVVVVGGKEVGVVVDQVKEVLPIPDEEIRPPPALGADVPTQHLLGIATTGGKGGARLLLAIDRILTPSEVRQTTAAA
jgi:purine-binding chemotaxis protein CheW